MSFPSPQLLKILLFCFIRAEFRLSSGLSPIVIALNKVLLAYLTFSRDIFALTVYRDAIG